MKTRLIKQSLPKLSFKDPQKLLMLERIIHPLVYAEHQRFIKDYQDQKFIALEIPLLFETGEEKLCHYVLYTTCQPNIARERIKKRGWSEMRYQTTLKRLIPDAIKLEMSHFLIDTGTSKVNTWHQIKDALQEICNTEDLNA